MACGVPVVAFDCENGPRNIITNNQNGLLVKPFDVDEYADKLNSPYSSESFGGYSYSKASGTDNHGNDVTSWQSKFASRLNHWRKIF
jgi:glycosyltransferase involved in cell wall biosynthesis